MTLSSRQLIAYYLAGHHGLPNKQIGYVMGTTHKAAEQLLCVVKEKLRIRGHRELVASWWRNPPSLMSIAMAFGKQRTR